MKVEITAKEEIKIQNWMECCGTNRGANDSTNEGGGTTNEGRDNMNKGVDDMNEGRDDMNKMQIHHHYWTSPPWSLHCHYFPLPLSHAPAQSCPIPNPPSSASPPPSIYFTNVIMK